MDQGLDQSGASTGPVLYLRLKKQVKIRKDESVTLAKVADFIAPPGLEQQLERLVLIQPEYQDGNAVLIDMMLIVRKVRELRQDIQIEYFGQPHTLLGIEQSGRRFPGVFLLLACFLLFVGSGLAIMNFHADVSMKEVHQRLYELITGRKTTHPYILQITYSIGIGLGMLIFFNHWFKKKWNEEPSPLEVEMYLYQENVNDVMITEEYRKLGAGEDPR